MDPNSPVVLTAVSERVKTLLGGWRLEVNGAVEKAIGSSLISGLGVVKTNLGISLAADTLLVAAAVDAVIAELNEVVAITVNVQPDQPNAPGGTVAITPTGDSSGRYQVSALRIDLLPGTIGTTYVALATSTAGVNARLP